LSEIVFEVTRDEAGNYCASASTYHGSLNTDAATLDELVAMIADLLALYTEDTGDKVDRIVLRLGVPLSQAA